MEKHGYSVETATSGDEAIARIARSPFRFSLVVLDFRLEDKTGAEITEILLRVHPDLQILILSGDPSRDAVLLSSRSGALSFVDKKEGTEVFLKEVTKLCLRIEEHVNPINHPRAHGESEKKIKQLGMVGRSSAMADLAETVARLRDRQGPCLILGESGTGKELIARALHRDGPFRAVNCANFLLNKEMARSELFGHVRGAFTGAHADRPGVFEEAEGGTVFLDELYALPLEAQLGLLRALQEKVITRLGANKEIPIRCRIVASSKRSIFQDITTNQFSPDLFYRLSQNIIQVPSLRERTEDIEPLIGHFSEKWCQENGERKTFLASTLPFFERYPWPGNVRELENVVFRLLNTSHKTKLAPPDLDKSLFTPGSAPSPRGTLQPLRREFEKNRDGTLYRNLEKCHIAPSRRQTARHFSAKRASSSPKTQFKKWRDSGKSPQKR